MNRVQPFLSVAFLVVASSQVAMGLLGLTSDAAAGAKIWEAPPLAQLLPQSSSPRP